MPANKFEIAAIFKAVDRVTGPVRAITRSVQTMTAPMRRVGRAVSSIADVSGFRNVTGAVHGLGRSVGGLSRHLSSVAGPLGMIGGAATIAGITKLTTGYATAGDRIAKFSRQVGLSAEAYQELKYAADRSGVSASDFDTAMDGLSRRLGEAKAGTGSLVSFLNKTSPALLQQVQGAESSEEAFELLTKAMSKVEDPSKRAAMAAAAFGRSGGAMVNLMAGGNAEIGKLRAEAKRLGMVIGTDAAGQAEAFVDSMTNFKAAANGLGNVLGGQLLPQIQPLLDGLTKWITANRELIASNITAVVQQFSEFLRSVDWGGVWESVKNVTSGIAAFVDRIGGVGNAAIGIIAVMNGPLIGSFLKVGTEFLKLGKVFLASPIGAAIALIGGAVYVIYKNWDNIVSFFEDKFAGVKAAFDEGFISGILKVLEEFNPVTLIAEAMNGLIKYLTGFDLGAIISEKIRSAVNIIPDGLRKFLGIGDADLNLTASGPSAAPAGGAAGVAGAGRGRDAQANVNVRFENAPRGTRVESEAKGDGLDLGVETGSQLAGALL